MKPKIFVAMHYMELGGAETALLGLLQSVNPNFADVDVFIYAHRGELMQYLYNEVSREKRVECRFHLLPEIEAYSLLEEPIIKVVKKGYWCLAFARILGKWEGDRFSKRNSLGLESNAMVTFQQRRTVHCLPMINPDVEYDLAISFLTPHYIVLDKVCAKKKLGWIHTDYTNVFINRELELKMWERLDVISSISPDVTSKFVEVFPSLKDKIIDIENILSSQFIRLRSEVPCPIFEEDRSLKMLTIGRYSKAKKMEDIPFLCKKLLGAGLEIKWYIIGYGSEAYQRLIIEKIKEEGMEEYVILLGKQSNPYPFIRCCDVYVQPSLYEGKSITVREAQILCKPVVVTNYPTAPSQIKDQVDGVIVPLERDACADGMISFLKNTDLQFKIVDYLKRHDYGNEKEIEKIYKIAQS